MVSHDRFYCTHALLSGSEVNKSTPLFIFAGFGGGYMEREQVEYVEKVVSDSEYDEVCVFCLCEGAEY